MNTRLRRGWRLAAAALIGAAALLAGCGSTPVAPKEITLAGVVVDGQRVARADESGLVGVYRNGAWVEGKAEMTLQVGDTVSTGPNAYALIRYPSGSELYLRPNTRGQVGSFTDMVGEVFAKIRGAFAIQTSFVKAGAEGTAYSVRSTPDGEYAVVVLDGTVRLSSLRAAWPAIALGPGTMGAGRPQVPPTAMPATAQELARTRAWVERMEQLLPPPSRYPGAGAALAVAGLVAIIAASSHDGGSGGPSAPTGLAPGSASAQQPPTLSGCRSLTLSWRPVSGAHDYVVTVEPPSSPTRSAAAAPTLTTGAASVALPRGLYGLIRWHVHARDARGKAGPESSSMHFYCPG